MGGVPPDMPVMSAALESAAPPAITLATLATALRWVAWQTQDRSDGKPTKVPHSPAGTLAKADDPSTWGTRSDAETRAARLPKPYGLGGVGIELGDLGTGLAVGGVDLDACRAPDGTLAPWAGAVVDRFASYTEISPSNTGAKVFFTYKAGDLPALQKAMGTKTGKKWANPAKGDHPPALELYLTGRYFAVTDRPLPNAPANLRTVPMDDLLWLMQIHGPGAFKAANADGSRSAVAMRKGTALRRAGCDYEGMVAGLHADPETAAWTVEKGEANGQRELQRIWDKAGHGLANADGREFDPPGTVITEGAFADWQQNLQRDRGQTVPNLANAALALRQAPEFVGILAHDLMLRHTLVMRSLPGSRMAAVTDPRPLTDTDVAALQEWLQRHDLKRIGKDTVHQAVALVAMEHAFHPVQDYLTGLGWDGKARIDAWLARYLGADATEYTKAVGRMFLISRATCKTRRQSCATFCQS